MEVIDLVFLVLLLIGGYRGFQKGLLLELIALSSIFLAVILSMRFMPVVSDFLYKTFPDLGGTIPLVSFIIVFVIVLVILNLVGKSIKKVLDLTLLGRLDDIMGLIVGLLKVSIILSFMIWIYNNLLGEVPEDWVGNSILFPYIQKLAPKLVDSLDFLFPYMEVIKEKIKNFSSNKEVLTQENITLCLQSIIS